MEIMVDHYVISKQTQLATPDATVTALFNLTIFDFDPLLKLNSVLAGQAHGGILDVLTFIWRLQ
ncbi:hypothetical protein H4582DRAFT_2085143 [Lactarius indigo]|nr:hypothetical protein H4582DRAFT_2085143 [Lactarius indigo]